MAATGHHHAFRRARVVTAQLGGARAVTVPGLMPAVYAPLAALAKRHDVSLSFLCKAILTEAAERPVLVTQAVAKLRAQKGS